MTTQDRLDVVLSILLVLVGMLAAWIRTNGFQL